MPIGDRRIYLDVAGRMHSLYKKLVLYPPPGYQFITQDTSWDKAFSAAVKVNAIYSFQQRVLRKIIPVNLAKAYLERFKKLPGGTDLTYATGHLVFRKEPWVVDVEAVTQLAGGSINHLRRYSKVIQRLLVSEYCQGIICWTDTERKTFLSNLDCREFKDKIKTVHLAVPKKNFIKSYNEDKVKLLFVGSVNIPGQFDLKGGKEVLEAFIQLRRKYNNLELVIRSDVPQGIRDRCRGVDRIKVLDGIIPWQSLEREFKSADIFIFPAHTSTAMVILDAMSYELPVITTDVRANSELVKDGKTGFVIKKSEKVPYYANGVVPQWGTPQFDKAIKQVDPKVVDELVEKTSILIENEALRREMGRAGRQEIETGKFSIERRNERLKTIFDEATA